MFNPSYINPKPYNKKQPHITYICCGHIMKLLPSENRGTDTSDNIIAQTSGWLRCDFI